MKKYLYLIILFIGFQSYSQYNENAPWMHSVPKKSAISKNSLGDVSDAFNAYWKTRDQNKKGSGFKPFKRWENHWKNYLLKNGNITNPNMIWSAWEQKQKLAKSKSNFSNWTSKGPYTTSVKTGQGRVNTFIIDPNTPTTYYVGAPSGGIWRSIDSGVNWTPLSDQLPQIGVSGIAIDPSNSNIIYIATGDDDAFDTYSVGVLKSVDAGLNWNKTGLDFSSTNSISNEIYIHPSNSNIIWASTSKGFFKTTDAGVNWNKKLSGNILDFKLKPGNPNIIYAVTSSGFWKSTNGGENFSKITSGLPTSSSRLAIDVSPANSDYVYLLSADSDNDFQGLYKSTNSGDSFSKSSETQDIFGGSKQAWYDMALTVSPTNENTVFVGVLDIWRSTNGGDNFTQINHWNNSSESSYTHADIHFLRFFNNKLYAGTDGGIYESGNNGSDFTDLTENLNISQYYKIATAKNSVTNIVGGLQDNGGFGFINNIWNKYHGGDGMDCVVSPNDKNLYYGFTQFGGSLNITYNGGTTQGGTIANAPSEETGTDDAGGNWITPLISNSEGKLYAGYSKLYTLNNNVWEAVSSNAFGGDLDNIAIATSDKNIFFVSKWNVLYKSIDGGITFNQISFNFPNSISSISIHNQNSNIIYISNSGFNGNVYQSTDGGDNWTDITKNLPSEPKLVVKHQSQSLVNDLYLGTSLGVYHTNDTMTEWEVFDNNLPNVPVFDIEINSEEEAITVGTYGRGVWQSPIEVSKSNIDISLIHINPNNLLECSGISPVITIKNNGLNTFSQIDIIYLVDNQSYSHTIYGNVLAGETKEIELPNNDLIDFGNHSLKIEIDVANDSFSENNSLMATFTTNKLGSGQYINTFGDTNSDDWIVNTKGSPTDLWQKGIANTTIFNNKFDNSYTTNLTGNYSDETLSYLISPCFDLSVMENPVLKFDMVFDIEQDWDVLYMEYTLDSGSNWEILGTSNDANWYNSSFISPQRPITVGKQWTGTDSTIKEYSYDLATFTDESSIIFRYVFASDQSENGEGVSIDNFVIDASIIRLGVNDIADKGFKIYPNPSSSVFNIQRIGNEEMQVYVFDLTGKLVFKAKDIYIANYALVLPSQISRGLYFLKIIEGNKHITKRLMVK